MISRIAHIVAMLALPTFFVLFLSTSSIMQVHARTHLFLQCGQSNSVGENSQGPVPSDITSPNLLQLSCCTDNNTKKVNSYDQCTLVEAQDPLLHYCPPHHISMGMTFLRNFNATIPEGDTVLIVPSGLDGTGFSDGEHTWLPPYGPGYVASIAKLQQAYKLAIAQDPDTVFAGVIWHQGETDAGDNTRRYSMSTEDYIGNFTLLANEYRNTTLLPFSGPKVPIVVGQMLPQWVYNTKWPLRLGVAKALEMMPTVLPYSGFANSEGLIGDPVYRSGTDNSIIHFTAPSQRILGRRYFEAYTKILEQIEMERVQNN